MASVTVACPRCAKPIELAMEGLGQDHSGRAAIVQLRTEPFVAHLRDCSGQRREQLPDDEQAAVAMVRGLASLIPKGARACTMCGGTNGDCLQGIADGNAPCCESCSSGDTHPAPKATLSCAEWGAEHGPRS